MKMKPLFIIGILFIIIGAGILAMALFIRYTRNNIMDGPGMINVREIESIVYSRGGGSLGDSYVLELNGDKLHYTKKEWHSAPVEEKECTIDQETHEAIVKLLEEGGVRQWTDLKKTDMFAYDAPTTNFCVTFADGLEIRVGNDDIPPDGGWNYMRSVIDLLEKVIE